MTKSKMKKLIAVSICVLISLAGLAYIFPSLVAPLVLMLGVPTALVIGGCLIDLAKSEWERRGKSEFEIEELDARDRHSDRLPTGSLLAALSFWLGVLFFCLALLSELARFIAS